MRNDPLPLNDPGGLGIFNVMAKALAPPPFRPDFRARRDRREPAGPAMPPNASAKGQEKVSAPKRGLLERLEHWFWAQRQRDLEGYLGQSTDIHELEARIRGLERDPSHPYY